MDKQTWLDLLTCINAAKNSNWSSTIDAADRADEWLMSQDYED